MIATTTRTRCPFPASCRCSVRAMMDPGHGPSIHPIPPVSPWVRRAMARTLPASDRTGMVRLYR